MQAFSHRVFQPGDAFAAALRGLAWVEDARLVRCQETPNAVLYVLPKVGQTTRISEVTGLAAKVGELAPLIVLTDSIEHSALPRPDPSRLEVGGVEFVAPRGGLESEIAQVWMEVLGEERVGRFDSFRNTEGYSLVATQVAARLAVLLGYGVRLRDVHEADTVWQLAARLHSAEQGTSRPLPFEFTPVSETQAKSDLIPLSAFQQRIWNADRLSRDASYHIAVGWRIRGPMDVAVFQAVWTELQQRHEAIRIRIDVRGAIVTQRVVPSQALAELSVLQLTDAGEKDPDLRDEPEACRPFNLENEPPLRGHLVRLAPDDHALRVTLHHVVADGWTLGLLTRDLADLYRAKVRRTGVPAIQALSLRELVDDENRRAGTRQADEAYWKAHLDLPAPRLMLPFDHPDSAEVANDGDSVAFEIPQNVALSLKRYAAGQRCTVFSAVASVLQAFLFRLGGQRCIRIGYPVARRSSLAREQTAGCLINTLVLQATVAPSDTIDQLVVRAHETLLESSEHEDVLLERIAGQPVTDRPFEVLINFNEFDQPALELEGLSVEALPRRSLGAPYALAWILSPGDGTFLGRLEYRTDRFNRATTERLVEHWLTFLESAMSSPSTPIHSLSWMRPEQVQEAIAIGDPSFAMVEAPELVHRRFEMQARQRPSAVAIICDKVMLTYAELDRHADLLAQELVVAGLSFEGPVAVCLSRSVWQAVCLLGALKAGGIYIPIDPSTPDARIQRILAGASVQHVLTDEAHVARFPTTKYRLVVGRSRQIQPNGDAPSRFAPVNAAHAAYCLYTSGSTGTPKGVVVSHGALAHHVSTASEAYAMCESDRVLQFASSAFDTSLEQMLVAWHNGASVIMRGDALWSADELADSIQEYAISVADIPASYWPLLRSRMASGREANAFGLRLLIVGGEPIVASADTRRPLLVRALNAYGPTETTITCISGELDDRAGCHGPFVSIGRPFPGTRICILDERLQAVPQGVIGEICIGGHRLARGYLGRPDLTAECFVPDPYGMPGDRIYRSGDRGRFLPGGRIEFLGRKDDQVKVRGVRVELGEVEVVLMAHQLVRNAAVFVEGDSSHVHLVACVVLQGGRASLDEVKRFARLELGESMLPSLWLVMDSLPLTPHAKVDRAALAATAMTRAMQAEPVPSCSQDQQSATLVRLQSVLEGLLPGRLGNVDAALADAGIHSVVLVRLIARCQDEFGVALKPRDLLKAGTVRRIAERIDLAASALKANGH